MALDPFSTAIATEIGKVVIKTVWDGSGKALGMFGRKANAATQDLINQAAQTYVKKYGDRHGLIQVLGMREPVKLEDVYTAVRFLDEHSLQSFESVEAQEQFFRQSGRRSFQDKDCPKQNGLAVANETQYLMVLGRPGAGKSTFLKRMGLEALKLKKGGFQHGCIPVLIELRDFNNREIDIKKAIAEEFRLCGFPNYEEQTEKFLKAGKLLILLDGLDEVATEQTNDAIRQIQNFITLHDKNRLIASCRVAASRYNLRAFTHVTMADFDDEQIQHFIINWFCNEPEIAKACWEKLNSPNHIAAKELTQTPLLLTLVCLLYRKWRKFPTNRATLYERALRVLLEEWAADEGKETHQEEIYKGLDTKRKEMLLPKIAHDAFQQNRLFLTRREIANQIEDLLKEMLPDEKNIDGAAVLRSIEVQHGILVERAEGIYSFSHLTLQEYLTAQYIDDHRQIESLVAEHLTDDRWREVFILVAGLMRGGADTLLQQMETAAQQFINTDKLKNLLRWTQQATDGSEGDFKPAAKRLLALYIALSITYIFKLGIELDLGIDSDFNRALDIYLEPDLELDLSVANSLDLALDIDSGLSLACGSDANHLFDLRIDEAISITYDLPSLQTTVCELKKLKIFNNSDFDLIFTQIEIFKAQIPEQVRTFHGIGRLLCCLVLSSWFQVLNLDAEFIKLSVEESKALEKFVVINRLIVRCKEAAVWVSPQVWAGIEERMLTVRDEG
jgi:hypothetical protein